MRDENNQSTTFENIVEFLISILMIPMYIGYFGLMFFYSLVISPSRNIPYAIRRKLKGTTFREEMTEFLGNYRRIDIDGIEVMPVVTHIEEGGFPLYQYNFRATMCGPGEKPDRPDQDGYYHISTGETESNRRFVASDGTIICKGLATIVFNFSSNRSWEWNAKEFEDFIKITDHRSHGIAERHAAFVARARRATDHSSE